MFVWKMQSKVNEYMFQYVCKVNEARYCAGRHSAGTHCIFCFGVHARTSRSNDQDFFVGEQTHGRTHSTNERAEDKQHHQQPHELYHCKTGGPTVLFIVCC